MFISIVKLLGTFNACFNSLYFFSSFHCSLMFSLNPLLLKGQLNFGHKQVKGREKEKR